MKKFWLSFCLCVLCASAFAETPAQLFARAKQEPNPQTQIKLLNKVIAQSPRMVNAYHYRGDAYRSLGRPRQAVEDYTHTIRLRPKDPFRYYARALTYLDMGRASLAVADLTKAISLKPSYQNFYLSRARAYAAVGKYETALADYKKYLRNQTPPPDLALEMAQAYLGAFRYEEAEKQLDLAAGKGDDSAELHFGAAVCTPGKGVWTKQFLFTAKPFTDSKIMLKRIAIARLHLKIWGIWRLLWQIIRCLFLCNRRRLFIIAAG